MKYVYVLEHHYDYEGSEVDGVYTSLELARRACKLLKHRGDRQTITRRQLDASGEDGEVFPLVQGGSIQ